MGGIAIWCMHFIGNRAIVLGNGEAKLQIVYNVGFTILSLVVAIIALFLALWAMGSNERVSITRITLGGTLAGFGVCGMHYVGQAGIANYDCIYIVPYVVGSCIIAVLACTAALGVFYLYRSLWNNSWWKRVLCAMALSFAISGMHWLAAVGTQYRLKKIDQDLKHTFSRNGTVILVILLVSGTVPFPLGLLIHLVYRWLLDAYSPHTTGTKANLEVCGKGTAGRSRCRNIRPRRQDSGHT